MQTLLNLLAPVNAVNPARSPNARDDGRDKWVGLVSAVGLCALAASDLISLL